ncbi:MAG: 2-C-methyl-D-erythritol 2,4-cyclodiphosphate synthase [Clostridiales bacterium]|jgi:2-C-methyl-D-erythritol 2,4-cyclodiphosphate synthase/2-C-methyl-D-erythritol 4-phosphate cytidylyltransferase|nr:2-C-methyl-D-erythritol 2,4-cyclodiphosphate synthase [Clostridiales bacterium]
MKINVIIPAAGSGTRAKAEQNKIFIKAADGKTVLERCVKAFLDTDDITRIIVAAKSDEVSKIKLMFRSAPKVDICEGGETRAESVKRALSLLEDDCGAVLIHDAARPYIEKELIERVICETLLYGSSVPVLPVMDALKQKTSFNGGSAVYRAVDRSVYLTVSTPQGYIKEDLIRAYSHKDISDYHDDSSLYEKYIAPVRLTKGQPSNLKITLPEDAEQFKASKAPSVSAAFPRIGNGYDIHRLAEGRKLILGGTDIPYDKGLDGHSDADVLTHGIIDALLSASGNKDIGTLFPDTDKKYKDISSVALLEKVARLIYDKGFLIINISCVLIAERPKLSPYVDAIISSLSKVLNISPSQISLSLKTNEGIDCVGEGLAIAAHCVCLLILGG